MSDTVIDYTYSEVRAAMGWVFSKQKIPAAMVEVMMKKITDTHIRNFEISDPNYRDETQFMVAQYREAVRNQQV